MAGKEPRKAKAASQRKTASLLLPHLVDELLKNIAPKGAFVNDLAGTFPWRFVPRGYVAPVGSHFGKPPEIQASSYYLMA